jgi:hypothetical protein
VTTVPLNNLGRMELEEGPNGRGTIVFLDHRIQPAAEEFLFPLMWRNPTLFSIPDAAKVRDEIFDVATELVANREEYTPPVRERSSMSGLFPPKGPTKETAEPRPTRSRAGGTKKAASSKRAEKAPAEPANDEDSAS